MSKNNDNNKYVMFQTLRRGKNNNGVCMQITPTNNGNIIFTLAHQIGLMNNLPKFDYENSLKLGFSDIEAAKIALTIERELMSGGFETELKFPHLAAANPKNIVFKFSVMNNKLQCAFSVFPTNNSGKSFTIYLSEEELYVLKLNLDSQVNLYEKKNLIELNDTREFKQAMFNK